MKKPIPLEHEFVKLLPEKLAERTVYVSVEYATAAHLCLCGCGVEVQTPLSPSDWQLRFDGEAISLYPSIGNWGLTCRSHYWIREDEGRWAGKWTEKEIATTRRNRIREKTERDQTAEQSVGYEEPTEIASRKDWISILSGWLLKLRR